MIKSNGTSQASGVQDSYKCPKCKDTGWFIDSENNCIRCECYKRDYIERLWSNFGIKPDEVKKINDYIPYDEVQREARDKAVNYLKNFDYIRSTNTNSFALLGQPGSGKSHLIIAIGAALINKDKPVSVVYMPYLEAMRQLKSNAMDDEYYLRLSDRYSRAEVLIIDDLFKDKIKNGKLLQNRYGEVVGLTEADMKHIYPILNYRYINNKATLISSECTPEMLTELDEALAGRILEKCGSNIVVFKGKMYDYRMRKFIKQGGI